MDSSLSKSEMQSLLDISLDMYRASSAADIESALQSLSHALAIEQAIIIIGSLDSNKSQLANLSTFSYSNAGQQEPVDEKYYAQSPIIQKAIQVQRPFSLDLSRLNICPKTELEGHLLVDGGKSNNHNASFLMLDMGLTKPDLHHLDFLRYLTPHLLEAGKRIQKSEHSHAIKLSNREREVLQWMCDGKSTWEISTILAISERTVKFHSANICKKLQANNRTHAIIKAISLGIAQH